ncbi:uncharacterized protein LOC143288171 [Babylonia areolata]|uniref:uncharacterized protein LOC143288171 n=1 Tax=Babylonia areolata TaxID=304850 RepID=UPI003FD35338
MGNLRAQCLMLKRHLKSDNSHLRTKRSSKRNRHLKVNKSKKLTGKAGKKPKKKNGSLKVDEAEKVTVKQIRMPTTRQMTDTGNSTTAVLATNRSQKTGDDDVIPHRTYESSALFKGNITSAASVAEGGMNVKEQSVGARSSPGQTTLSESGQSDERMAGSDHGADVENSTVLLGLDGQPVNMTKLLEFLKKMDFERQLSQASQWAYLCVVVLICLMMWTIWCLGGFDHCRYRPNDFFRFTDMQPLTSVKEVLRNKRQYLPMFNEPEWEEVLMCDRGSGP